MTNKEVHKHLEALRARHQGLLCPEAAVVEAQDPDHPLHDEFDWNDSTAAHKHRLNQARRLFRRVYTEFEIDKSFAIKAPVYVHDANLPKGVQGYRPTVSFQNDTDRARAVMMQELDRVLSTLNRARAVATVIGLQAELETILTQVGGLRQKVEDEEDKEGGETVPPPDPVQPRA